MEKIPVILDTDIGADIDDTWAAAMMLKCPELDVKLMISDTGNTRYRTELLAKLAERAGRTDIPVGKGIMFTDEPAGRDAQGEWVKEYELSSYPGTVHEDGVQAIVDTIMNSQETVTLIAIGPVPNIAKAIEIEPAIVPRTRFVGMHGSIYRGYQGAEKMEPIAEYNVKADIAACRKVLAAPWKECMITPLDTCACTRLSGDLYRKIFTSADPVMRAVIENYRIWTKTHERYDYTKASSRLFDTVAVHLAYSTEFLNMERMNILVDDEGYTRIDDADGAPMNVAISWKDLDAYHAYLTERLLSPVCEPKANNRT
ncbi:MAG: nucleoside hydrolase [Phycisphaerae bacterium]|nr:nucleoside hydrolase [Phycisphaerae bacterium]